MKYCCTNFDKFYIQPKPGDTINSAAMIGDSHSVRGFIETRGEDGCKATFMAVRLGHLEMFSYLLRRGVASNETSQRVKVSFTLQQEDPI